MLTQPSDSLKSLEGPARDAKLDAAGQLGRGFGECLHLLDVPRVMRAHALVHLLSDFLMSRARFAQARQRGGFSLTLEQTIG